MSDRHEHWQEVYSTKAPEAVSWFQPSPDPSLRMIEAAGIAPPASVIDVGGGASGLVDVLVSRGFAVTVLDIAEAALEVARRRMGRDVDKVEWLGGDVTRWRPDKAYDLWHDRAVFHFLTEAPDRQAYLEALRLGVRAGGYLVMATFAEDGPERCSGLPVRRYSASDLADELGAGFELLTFEREQHSTPWGSEQRFTWTLFRRGG